MKYARFFIAGSNGKGVMGYGISSARIPAAAGFSVLRP